MRPDLVPMAVTIVVYGLLGCVLLQGLASGQSASEGSTGPGPYVVSVKEFGAEGDWDWGNRTGADDTAAIQKAIDYAATPGAKSAVVYLPAGSYRISSTIRLPNYVCLRGDNGRNSQIHADPDFTDACMFHAANGEQSMFHSRLENLWIRVHDNPAIQAVIRADAWQENCGMSRVVITGFTRYGLELQFGYGGAASLLLDNCEIFAGPGAVEDSAGVYVRQISLVAGFMLRVESTTITGASSDKPLGYGVFMENDTLVARVVHFEYTKHGVWLERGANAVLDALTGSYTRTDSADLVGLSENWGGFLVGRGLMPNGFECTVRDHRSGDHLRGNVPRIALPQEQ